MYFIIRSITNSMYSDLKCKLGHLSHFVTVLPFHALKKSNLHYIRGITPKRVTSGGIHLRGLASEQRSSEETMQRRQTVGDTYPVHMFNFSGQ